VVCVFAISLRQEYSTLSYFRLYVFSILGDVYLFGLCFIGPKPSSDHTRRENARGNDALSWGWRPHLDIQTFDIVIVDLGFRVLKLKCERIKGMKHCEATTLFIDEAQNT